MIRNARRLASMSALALFLVSCETIDGKLATVWTDVPEIALYAELFNKEQSRYRIEIVWKAELVRELRDTKEAPTLAIGRSLRSSIVRDRFQSLDYLFGDLTINRSDFYPDLLALGTTGGNQILLPVSFNLPAMIYRKDGEARPQDPFTIGLEAMAAESAAFNQKQGETYTRMGFSPRWDPHFLVLATNTAGAAFREGKPLYWSESGLRSAIDRMRGWGGEGRPSPALADDFQFKYLFTPPYTYVAEGRALFAYLSSADLFLVPEEKRSYLDFRWFLEAGSIPILDDLVFAGIPRAGKDQPAAEAFLGWLFKEGNQQAMLESARRTRALESSFGIAGGFSTIRAVSERVFPLYYSALAGHVPPAETIGSPAILPVEWTVLETEILGPWLRETLGRQAFRQEDYTAELSAGISDYLKSGRNGR